jgi:hypothetical protein
MTKEEIIAVIQSILEGEEVHLELEVDTGIIRMTPEFLGVLTEHIATKLVEAGEWKAQISANIDPQRSCVICRGPIEFGQSDRCKKCVNLSKAVGWREIAEKNLRKLNEARDEAERMGLTQMQAGLNLVSQYTESRVAHGQEIFPVHLPRFTPRDFEEASSRLREAIVQMAVPFRNFGNNITEFMGTIDPVRMRQLAEQIGYTEGESNWSEETEIATAIEEREDHAISVRYTVNGDETSGIEIRLEPHLRSRFNQEELDSRLNQVFQQFINLPIDDQTRAQIKEVAERTIHRYLNELRNSAEYPLEQ